jgi:tetratricopeptide (TPR) repeat protein
LPEASVRAIRATLMAIADDARVPPISPDRATAVRDRLMADVRARRRRVAPRGRTIAWALAFSALGGVAVAAPGAAERLRAWAQPVVDAIVEVASSAATPSAGRRAELAARAEVRGEDAAAEAPPSAGTDAAAASPREPEPAPSEPAPSEPAIAERAPADAPAPASARRGDRRPRADEPRTPEGVALDDVDALRPETEAEASFREGWAAFSRGDHAGAAERLARAIALDPAAPLAEDAAYTRAVALARAARPDDAIAAFERYLSVYPVGARRDEARVALGELLVDAGRHDDARGPLEAARGSALEPVRRRAERALERLARP